MSGSFHLKKFEFGRSFISSLWITATYPHFLDRGARRPFVSAYPATVVCTIPPATKSFASRRKLKPSAARSADCRTPKFVFASGLFNPCRFVVPIFPSTWARSRVMRSFTRGPTSHFASQDSSRQVCEFAFCVPCSNRLGRNQSPLVALRKFEYVPPRRVPRNLHRRSSYPRT